MKIDRVNDSMYTVKITTNCSKTTVERIRGKICSLNNVIVIIIQRYSMNEQFFSRTIKLPLYYVTF